MPGIMIEILAFGEHIDEELPGRAMHRR